MVSIGNVDFGELGLGPPRRLDEGSGELGQEDFLKLMIAQFRNQDPFKPMEDGQFLGQLAQFGTVSGLEELNRSFGQLADSLVSNQALQASSLVGRDVVVPASTAAFRGDGRVEGAVDLRSPATSVRVQIMNGAGQLVRQIELGPQSAGNVAFRWGGETDAGVPATPGVYRISAQAVVNGQVQAAESLIRAEVQSVSIGDRGLVLRLPGIGDVAFSDVRSIG
jgi:flagellar basal-body rod modification protein FlgD